MSGTPPFDPNQGPQDGAIPPWNPPPGAHGQPGPPPPPPAGYGQPYGVPSQPKKSRWPWVVGGCLLGLLLLVGGCGALIAWGINEISEVEDQVAAPVETMFANAMEDNFAEAARVAEGLGGCSTEAELEAQLADLDPDGYTIDQISFVQRGGTTYFSNTTNEDALIIDGRENESGGAVLGNVDSGSIKIGFVVELVEQGVEWKVCRLIT